MPAHVILFYALLTSAALAATIWGAAPERIGAAMLVSAAVLTVAVRQGDRYRDVQVGVAVVDLVLLAGLVWLSVHAARTWPTWCASFHLVTTTGHLIKTIHPGVLNTVYALLLILSAYPTILLLAAGVWTHQQRTHGRGYDPSWTRQPRFPTWLGVGGR